MVCRTMLMIRNSARDVEENLRRMVNVRRIHVNVDIEGGTIDAYLATPL